VEEDIHKVREYFSYEHFYVLYCKFWELDTDHDFYLTKEEFSRYDGHALNKLTIDRIFNQVPRLLYSDKPGQLNYRDFIYFMLAEQDRSNEVSIDYWFKVCDLDNNGIIAGWELNAFYEE